MYPVSVYTGSKYQTLDIELTVQVSEVYTYQVTT